MAKTWLAGPKLVFRLSSCLHIGLSACVSKAVVVSLSLFLLIVTLTGGEVLVSSPSNAFLKHTAGKSPCLFFLFHIPLSYYQLYFTSEFSWVI